MPKAIIEGVQIEEAGRYQDERQIRLIYMGGSLRVKASDSLQAPAGNKPVNVEVNLKGPFAKGAFYADRALRFV